MLRKSTLSVMAIGLIFSAIISNAYGDDKILIMPKELVDIAEINGYEQVDDFYNLPGMLEPCYIYGYKEGDQENSAVFWVKKKGEKKRKVYLFFVSRKSWNEQYIVDEILGWGKYGRGLSFFADTTMILDDFHLLYDQNTKGPRGVLLSAKGIKLYYDGVVQLLYKYNNKWYVRDFH
jgi:hypothetical protein